MQILGMLLAALVGAGLVVQVGMNAALRHQFGNATWATIANFAVGTFALLALALVTRTPVPTSAQAGSAPWWAWCGGLLGAAYVASVTVLGPRLGAATLTAVVVAAQMTTALVIDHYGLVGFAEHAATPGRLLGAALIIVGVVLVSRG
jgi:transporter family-2 protein